MRHGRSSQQWVAESLLNDIEIHVDLNTGDTTQGTLKQNLGTTAEN